MNMPFSGSPRANFKTSSADKMVLQISCYAVTADKIIFVNFCKLSSSLNIKDPHSHPYNTTGKIIVWMEM
jgi:hypothetical protein